MNQRRREQGVGIVTAAFILFVLTAAGAAMIRLSSTQTITSTQALLAAQAIQVARSGIQREMNLIIEGGGAAECFDKPAANFAGTPFTLDTDCTKTDHDEAGEDFDVFWIESEAFYSPPGATSDRIRRKLEATITDRDFP